MNDLLTAIREISTRRAMLDTPLTLGADGGEFSFSETSPGLYSVTSNPFDSTSPSSISMTGKEFKLAVSWGNGISWFIEWQSVGSGDQCILSFTDGNSNGATLAVDLQPVPLPAAAWLFGSALFGLIAVARRKQVA